MEAFSFSILPGHVVLDFLRISTQVPSVRIDPPKVSDAILLSVQIPLKLN